MTGHENAIVLAMILVTQCSLGLQRFDLPAFVVARDSNQTQHEEYVHNDAIGFGELSWSLA